MWNEQNSLFIPNILLDKQNEKKLICTILTESI